MQSDGPSVVSCLNVVVLNTSCNKTINNARPVILTVTSHVLLSGFLVLPDQRREF